MSKTIKVEIEHISYPPEHLEALKRTPELVVSAMKRDGMPEDSGYINLGKVDEDLNTALFFFYWTSDINEIFDNLNIVLSDLRALPLLYRIQGGSPGTRYKLLVHTFFHEFYRLRELFRQAIKAAANHGFLPAEDVPEARKVFHDAFAGTIGLRNAIVHGELIWKGKKNFMLTLAEIAWERDEQILLKETGEYLSLTEILKENCDSAADALRDEGVRMSKILQLVIRLVVEDQLK